MRGKGRGRKAKGKTTKVHYDALAKERRLCSRGLAEAGV